MKTGFSTKLQPASMLLVSVCTPYPLVPAHSYHCKEPGEALSSGRLKRKLP